MNGPKESVEARVERLLGYVQRQRAKLAVDLKYGKIDRLEARAQNLVLTARLDVLEQIKEVL